MALIRGSTQVNSRVSKSDWDALCILLGGILGMAIAMGVGRFAFTPILPLMQRDLGLSNSIAGWLAGLNYLGYLAGAVLCSFVPRLLRSRYIAVCSLLLSIATTLAMGLTVSVFLWGTLRLASGLASALLFIMISAEVGESLVKRGHGHWIGALYGGIGGGIALSGLMIPWLDRFGQWSGAWIGIGGLTAVLAILSFVITKDKRGDQKFSSMQTYESKNLLCLWPLVVAYFFEGLGYIVTATFIVAVVAMTPGLEAYASYSWVAVGLASIPSTVFWPLLSRHVGKKNALLAAYAIQAAGIFVSIHADTVFEVMFAAITFGGTFLGIVALTLAEGTLRIKHGEKQATAILTVSFGAGQIIGPLVAGYLADLQKGFALPLLLAATCTMVGWVFTAVDRHFVLQKQ